MIIDNMNSLSLPIVDDDEMAVERGTRTYKMQMSALLNAIHRTASASLDNCASIEEVYQVLIANGGVGIGNVGNNNDNNFKTLVGDPRTGSSSAGAYTYIDSSFTNGATMIHILVSGNNGIKHKYMGRHPTPNNNRQSAWASLDIANNLTSTDTDKALSANQGRLLNNKIVWTSLGTVANIGSTHYLTLPSGWTECCVRVTDDSGTNAGYVYLTNNILSYYVDNDTANYFRFGQPNYYATVEIVKSNRRIYIVEYYRNGTQITSDSNVKLTVYYR